MHPRGSFFSSVFVLYFYNVKKSDKVKKGGSKVSVN